EDTLRSLIQADDTEFKIYQDSIIQTITYNDADKRYLYTTYTFDDNSKSLKQIGEHPFTPNANNEKDEQEKAWKEEDWKDERYHSWKRQAFDDAIIPYIERDALASWELPATIVKDAEEGSVKGVPAHLGDDMWDVFQENKTIYDEYWLREDFFKLYGDDELAYKERRIDYGNYIIGYQPTNTFDETTEDAKKRYTSKITRHTIP